MLGGATAWSGGWMWAPLNPLSQADGIVEDIDAPRTYLKHALGRELRRAAGRGAAGERPAHGRVLREAHPRCSSSPAPGSPTSRATCPAPAPAAGRSAPSRSTARGSRRTCGRSCAGSCTRPRSSGMGIMAGPDLQAFLHATTSVKSFFHAAWRVAFHVLDLITYRQGMQLVNGTALIARLVKSADELGVQLLVNSPATRLLTDGRRGHRRGAAPPGRRGHRPGPARRPARRRWLPERRGTPPRALPAHPDRPGALDPGAAGDHRRRDHASASRRAGCSTRRWPRRPPGARCRWCPTAAAGSAPTRTSSTAASPA